jgi:hypothetical protein
MNKGFKNPLNEQGLQKPPFKKQGFHDLLSMNRDSKNPLSMNRNFKKPLSLNRDSMYTPSKQSYTGPPALHPREGGHMPLLL